MPRYHRVLRETHRERPKEAHVEQINDKTTWNCTIGTARLVRLFLQFLLINERNVRRDCECEVWEMKPLGWEESRRLLFKKLFWWTMWETHGGNKKQRSGECSGPTFIINNFLVWWTSRWVTGCVCLQEKEKRWEQKQKWLVRSAIKGNMANWQIGAIFSNFSLLFFLQILLIWIFFFPSRN